jgi:hypothetical protein
MDFDSLKDKAEGLVSEHGDQIEKGLDKPGSSRRTMCPATTSRSTRA